MGVAPERFSVDTERAGPTTTVRLSGELDMSGTFVLEPQLDDLVADPPDGAVVFDLRELRFIDSSGLAALIGAHERLDGAGVPTRFRRGPDDVQRIFALAGFEGLLPFTD